MPESIGRAGAPGYYSGTLVMEGTVDLSLPLAFTVGLFSSLHCIGMCGGIIGGLSLEARRQAGRMAIYLLALSAGRVLSYALAGALAGALLGSMGEVLQGVAGNGQVHLWLRWAAALIMVLIGMHIAGWLPRLAMIERLGVPLWARLEPLGRRLMLVQTRGGPSPTVCSGAGCPAGWSIPCGCRRWDRPAPSVGRSICWSSAWEPCPGCC